VDASERDRQQRVAERPQLQGAGLPLARTAGDGEASRRASEGQDSLVPVALVPGPDKDTRGAELEATQAADPYLEGSLEAAHARRLLLSLLLGHCFEDSLRAVRPRVLALVAALALALLGGAHAAASTSPPVRAKAVLVADGRTGDVLYARDADRRLAMASITKLMTALVTLENARPRDLVKVAPQAVAPDGSSIFLSAGEELRVRDLLAAALIQSANDAAYALAAHVGDGSVKRFVRLMNAEAVELGLDGTHYVRPDGLDRPGHYSTAEDTLRLARLAMREPLVRKLVRKRTAVIPPNRKLKSWNDLLWTFQGLVGVKTGHTDRAGWSEVAAARRGPTTIYAVVLGSPARAKRNADLTALLEWGFDQYAHFPLVTEGERYATAAIPFDDERLELVAAAGASKLVRLGDGTRFVERVVVPAMVELPVRKGEKLGEVVVMDGDREVARSDLVAARDVPEPTFRERLGWYADRALDEAGDIVSAVVPGI